MSVKALSIKQPFAELILQGRKKIELRKWNTNFRGEFLIHSPKTPEKSAMEKFGFQELPLGTILGRANLVDVKKYDSEREFDKDKTRHLATRDWGLYGFVLEGAKRIKPIPAKGQLNFWNFNLN